MLSSSSRRLWLVTLLVVPLGACGEPIDPVNLADQAALHAREIVHQSGGGVGFSTRDDSGVHKIGTGVSNAADAVAGAMPAAMPPGMMSAMGTGPMAMAMAGVPSMQTTEEQFDDAADQIKTWLRERVLADTNLESKTDDEAIYFLHPDPTCRALPVDGDPPGTIPPINDHCVDQLTRVEVRVSMRADGDGVRLTVMVGPQRLQLSAFIIHSDLLALETDLPQAQMAADYIDQQLGTDSPNPTQYQTLEGKLRLSVHKDGERKVTGAFSVLQAIHVATLDSNGGLGPDVQLAASDPTLAVTGDGVNETLTVKVNMGALSEKGNWDPAGTATMPNRDLHVAIGALTGQATFTESTDQIDITGLGVGDVAVDVRNLRVFDATLNPADMHRFNLNLAVDQATTEAVATISPRFDLSLGFQLGLIASELTSQPASYVLDESYGIKLDNGGSPAAITGAPATTTFGGGLKINSGTLSISSNKAPQPVVVPAGKCLTSVDPAPAGTHPLLGKLVVTDCP